MKLGIIYQARNIHNGCRYIGSTTLSIAIRKGHHWEQCRYGTMRFHQELRLWQRCDFEWTALETNIPEDKLVERERFWTLKYDSTNPEKGYNTVAGTSEGHPRTPEMKRAQSEAAPKKRVRCLETQNEYLSVRHAAEDLGVNRRAISNAIHVGCRLHGYTFVYESA